MKKKEATGKATSEVTKPKTVEYRRERREVAVDALKPAAWNPRGEITPESVADLAASIASLGLIQPLVAMEDMTLVAGHRRLAAAKLAGLETVPVDVLVGVDEATAKRMTFIENLQRTDADPLLESGLVGGLLESGMTMAEIAAETGRGGKWVARRANLTKLSPSWRKRVADGEKITTDCLEHVAAYPASVQERLKGVRGYSNGALRWQEIHSRFASETCELTGAKFNRKPCRTCPNNTGCAVDLFDWPGRVSAFGRCLDPKCYDRRHNLAIDETMAAAKKDGLKVVERKEYPGYPIRLQDKRDEDHATLYVWKDYDGRRTMQWGNAPEPSKNRAGCDETDEAWKEERQRKLAANKARRKLAKWCEDSFAATFAYRWQFVDVAVAMTIQTLFDIGSKWRVFGSTTSATDAALAYLLDIGKCGDAPKEQWARMAAPAIAAKISRNETGDVYAERLLAILTEAEAALTDEERRLIVSDERLEELRDLPPVKWCADGTDAEAEDAAMQGEDGEAAE